MEISLNSLKFLKSDDLKQHSLSLCLIIINCFCWCSIKVLIASSSSLHGLDLEELKSVPIKSLLTPVMKLLRLLLLFVCRLVFPPEKYLESNHLFGSLSVKNSSLHSNFLQSTIILVKFNFCGSTQMFKPLLRTPNMAFESSRFK